MKKTDILERLTRRIAIKNKLIHLNKDLDGFNTDYAYGELSAAQTLYNYIENEYTGSHAIICATCVDQPCLKAGYNV